MSRSKSILSVTIVLVLAAGVVVGRLWARLPVTRAVAPPATNPISLPVSPADALHLTPEQRMQMDEIWNEARAKIGQTFEEQSNAGKARDAKIQDLMSVEQWAAYDKIQDDYRKLRAEIQKSREKLIHDAEARSRALLTPDQQPKWDAMQQQAHHGPRPGDHGGPGHRNSSTTRPASGPAFHGGGDEDEGRPPPPPPPPPRQ